jgi:4a-hydroxytetrahydrobiopterin dehydratase
MDLSNKNCKACEGGVPPLEEWEIKDLQKHIKADWSIIDNKKLVRQFAFVNFKHTMSFVNKVADLAEGEGHHPDMHVSYGKVTIELWTHSINGLSENDFILAYRIDQIQ